MNWLDKLTAELKSDKRPIYLYGAGYLAAKYRTLLEKNDIPMKGYIVDEKYIPKEEEKRFINGLPIITVNDIAEDITVIIAVRANGFGTVFPSSPFIKKIISTDYSSYVTFGAFDENFMNEHGAELMKLYNRLADSASRFALVQFVTQRLTGTYRKQFSEKPQYFDNDIYIPFENEVVVDCGAYTGDSFADFTGFLKAHNVSSFRKYYALEPDLKNYEILCETVMDFDNVKALCMGAYDQKSTLHFNSGEGEFSNISDEGGVSINVDTIDNIVGDEKVTFIKMDIEGSELSALHGAEKTILKNKPRLAVCVYHRHDDLFRIPEYILSLVPEYKLFLRNYDPTGVDTVLYAVCE